MVAGEQLFWIVALMATVPAALAIAKVIDWFENRTSDQAGHQTRRNK